MKSTIILRFLYWAIYELDEIKVYNTFLLENNCWRESSANFWKYDFNPKDQKENIWGIMFSYLHKAIAPIYILHYILKKHVSAHPTWIVPIGWAAVSLRKKFYRTASLLRFLAVRVKIRQKLYSLPAEYVDCGTFPLCRYCPLTDFFLSIYSKSGILNVQPHKMCHSGL